MTLPNRITRILTTVAFASALATPAVAAGPAVVGQAATDDGCGPASGIEVSQEHRSYEQTSMESAEPVRHGRPGVDIDEMRSAGFTAPVLGEKFGLSVQRVSYRLDPNTGMGSGVVYLDEGPIVRDTTLYDVLVAGGVRVDEVVTPDGPTAAQRVAAMRNDFEFMLGPGRTTDIQIGPYPGVVLRGDEMVEGHRFYSVWFATGRQHSFALLTGAPTADEAVDQARSLVCD